MSGDRRALIAAIRDHPDDDTPRLVCADWFEEQGDETSVARADFIRTQVALARLAPTDPRQSELRARELRLLKRHAAAWCGSHFAFKKARFRRGFIEYVHLHLTHLLHHRRQLFALEPVRDASLTGWLRASDDLVRRVAACPELANLDTLRIHHQGPHKAPRGNLVLLLESPHLTRLRALRVPMLSFTADARRRFERSPVVGRLEELSLPSFDTYPNNPGPWFSDGGPPEPWANLRSLRLSEYGRNAIPLDRLCAMAFWDRLRSLSVTLPIHNTNDFLARLRDRLPGPLEEFRLTSNHGPLNVPDADSFFARLADTPLRVLSILNVPVSPAALEHLLGDRSRCDLRELVLVGCGLTPDHAAVLAEALGLRNVWSFQVGEYSGLTPAAVEAVLSSPHLESVTRLSLSVPPAGAAAANALATAPGWDRLHTLELTGTGVTTDALARLLGSPNGRGLVNLTVEDEYQGQLRVTPAVTARLAGLPHLANLRLTVGSLEDGVRRQLTGGGSPAWVSVQCHDDPDSYGFEPNARPPLDEELTELDQWS